LWLPPERPMKKGQQAGLLGAANDYAARVLARHPIGGEPFAAAAAECAK